MSVCVCVDTVLIVSGRCFFFCLGEGLGGEKKELKAKGWVEEKAVKKKLRAQRRGFMFFEKCVISVSLSLSLSPLLLFALPSRAHALENRKSVARE